MILGLLSDHPIRALYAGIVLLVVQQIDNHIISPNVMGRTVKLHPITVMLALLAAGSLFGIFGMLLIIPAIAALKAVAQHVWSKRSVREAIAEVMPDAATPEFVSSSVEVRTASGSRAGGVTETVMTEQKRTVVRRSKSARASASRRTTRGSQAAAKRRRSGSR